MLRFTLGAVCLPSLAAKGGEVQWGTNTCAERCWIPAVTTADGGAGNSRGAASLAPPGLYDLKAGHPIAKQNPCIPLFSLADLRKPTSVISFCSHRFIW